MVYIYKLSKTTAMTVHCNLANCFEYKTLGYKEIYIIYKNLI